MFGKKIEVGRRRGQNKYGAGRNRGREIEVRNHKRQNMESIQKQVQTGRRFPQNNLSGLIINDLDQI
jgi:hypothetical protein